MRTVRESTMTLSGRVLDAASGVGLAQPGNIPFSFTRTATGIYVIRFAGLPVFAAFMTPAGGGRCNLIQNQNSPYGTFQAEITNDAGVAQNGNFGFQALVGGLT